MYVCGCRSYAFYVYENLLDIFTQCKYNLKGDNMSKDYYQEKKISSISTREYSFFLSKKNVIGVAIGYKIIKSFYTCRKCIAVFVRIKVPARRLSEIDLIPKYYKGIPTDVVQCNIPKFESLTEKVRPVLNGYSVGNLFEQQSVGTCGCLVYDKYLYVLSCNHVLASNNQAPIQTSIIQPSVYDGGKEIKDVIGHLNRYIPINFIEGSKKPKNKSDSALAKVISRTFVSSSIAFLGIPKGTSEPLLLEEVYKVGRTTGKTCGKVRYTSATITVETEVSEKTALFTNQIIVSRMTEMGDSGSAVLNKDLNILGICMSGVDQITVVNPIKDILNSLGVKLVTQ